MASVVQARLSTQVSTQNLGRDHGYAERRERKKGVRYRSAGTFSTEERALAVAEEAERHA